MKITRTLLLGVPILLLAGASPAAAANRTKTPEPAAKADPAATSATAAPADEARAPRPANEESNQAAARDRLVNALVDHGLSRDAAQNRVAQLDRQDLETITPNQVQEAGAEPPGYIWTLLAILLVVAIVGAVF